MKKTFFYRKQLKELPGLQKEEWDVVTESKIWDIVTKFFNNGKQFFSVQTKTNNRKRNTERSSWIP